MAPVGGSDLLWGRPERQELVWLDRVGVLVPLRVHRVVAGGARQRVAGRLEAAGGLGGVLRPAHLARERLSLLVHLDEHGVQVLVSQAAAGRQAHVALALLG